VPVLSVDREKEKIALGLKAAHGPALDQVETKYTVGTKVRGTVVNIMSYGAFVQARRGHGRPGSTSAEMSWTRRITTQAKW